MNSRPHDSGTRTTTADPAGSQSILRLIEGLYARSPQRTLHTPFCKVRDRIRRARFLAATDGKHLTAVVACSPDAIELTWAESGRRPSLENLIAQVLRRSGPPAFIPLLESGRRNWSASLRLPVQGRCFRATYSGPPVGRPDFPAGFITRDCDPNEDLEAAANIVRAAYPSLRDIATAEGLRGMRQADYYFAPGWFFLVDSMTREKIGLAISGYDPEMDEGFIDWVELLPAYRHRGLGRLLVHESVRRLTPARLITVSGPLDAPFVMGELYRRCGFSQLRQWTILGHRWRAPIGLHAAFQNPRPHRPGADEMLTAPSAATSERAAAVAGASPEDPGVT